MPNQPLTSNTRQLIFNTSKPCRTAHSPEWPSRVMPDKSSQHLNTMASLHTRTR